MIDLMYCIAITLVIIQVLLLIFIKKSDKSWIYSIITVLTSIVVFIIVAQIEGRVYIDSPGLGEIGAGIITAGIRIISLVLSEITLYKSIKNICFIFYARK